MEGDKVVERIPTTGAAIARFGSENVRYYIRDYDAAALADPRSRQSPEESVREGDFCLCPIDIDYLLERTGYKRIEDERYDSMNTRIEKCTKS